MELEERYNELNNIVETLENLITDLDVNYMSNYISELLFTIDEAKREIEEIEPELSEVRDYEETIQENEYWQGSLGGIY